MNTRQKETTGQVLGGIVGAVAGTALAIAIQVALELNAPYFYLAGLAAGAAAGAGIGSWLVLRGRGLVKLAPGVYISAPGWKKAGMADGTKLTKGDATLVVTAVEGGGNASAGTLLEKYAADGNLTMHEGSSSVNLAGGTVGVQTGQRRSFTAAADGESFEGDVTVFVVEGSGAGMVFHASAPSGRFGLVEDEVHAAIASLERA